MEDNHLPFLLIFGFLNLALFVAGYLGKLLRFPAILFYILFGIFLGPFIHGEEAIEVFSEIGIVLLFFYLGLEFNLKRAFSTAKKIWIVGLFDFLFGFVAVTAAMYLMGFDPFISILTGAVAYASSSAITTKIIVDDHRIANPETELILGLMVFEDIIAPILLAVLSAIAIGNAFNMLSLGGILLKVILIFAFAIAVAFFLKNTIASFIERFIGEEIFTLFSIGGLILFSGFTQYIGLSEALGAFLMGMIVSESGKSHDIEKVMFSIRDLAVAIFFFLFGAGIQFTGNFDGKILTALIVVVIISIIGKFMTGFLGGLIYGLSKRKAIETGLSIINRGEFSVVMSKFAPTQFIPFIGIYVFIMAFLGIIFAQYAPKIANLIVPKKKKKKKRILKEEPA
ncbi:MAG TPA: cation:proton antiporter [Persephonella sp.]|uniref:Sodium/hydrogen exchanger n=1 Tax=Persephonella marina (strain DSM 14350 / EX-H1) TaxID=123214 RepID=C0QQD4_PERMH|nr:MULTISPECIES: cation:proton antiporter [Persephonella]ACO03133.1 sodium/hydrogen exchanger [Persephonella marina EX-H1]HCB69514.1 cation:proton antiporter [Persephonella sp.]